MKQAFLNIKNGNLELKNTSKPIISKGEILIKSRYSLISSGTERMLMDFGKSNYLQKALNQPERVKQVLDKISNDGLLPTIESITTKLNEPMPIGYSNFGIVLESNSNFFKPGDRVISNGYHSEVVCVGENLASKVPDSVDGREAAFTVVSSIALQGIRLTKPSIGEVFLIVGLGLIGQITAQILIANGCRVIGYDTNSSRKEHAKQFGVTICNADNNEDLTEFCKKFTGGHGVDATIITASAKNDEIINMSAKATRKKGRVTLVGVVNMVFDRNVFYEKELLFQVSSSYGPGRYDYNYEQKSLDYPLPYVRWTENRNFSAILQLIEDEKINLSPLISTEIEFNDIVSKYKDLLNGEGFGHLIKYDSGAEGKKKAVNLQEHNYEKSKSNENEFNFLGAGNYTRKVLLPGFKGKNVIFGSILSKNGVTSNECKSKFGFKTIAESEDEFFSLPGKGIVITTPHNQHSQQVITALKNNKIVFVEKPLSISIPDLEEIKEQLNLNPKSAVMVGFNRRFSSLTNSLRDHFQKKQVPLNISIQINAGQIDLESWIHDQEIGGGRIIGECCHFIDMACYLSNSKIVRSSAIKSNDSSPPLDNAMISMEMENGSVCFINYFTNGSNSYPKEFIQISGGGDIGTIDNFRKLHLFSKKKISKTLFVQDKGQKQMIAAYVDWVLNGGSAPIPLDEILHVSKKSIEISDSLLN